MKIPVYQADAFTEQLFGGNPAAICILEDWLPEETMQQIAMENNLSETAFLAKDNSDYHIRWFTPSVEVNLCGHATLAAAHILFSEMGYPEKTISFHSKSGVLKVTKQADGRLMLDFPANKPVLLNDVPAGIFESFGIDPVPVYSTSFDLMIVLSAQSIIQSLHPDFKTLAGMPGRGIIVTAKGDDADFVSRCFYPQSGIDEDPVTGSAHTIMVPYWAEQLGKTKMKAIQLSKRRGFLDCELSGNRVLMSGSAVTYMKGEIRL